MKKINKDKSVLKELQKSVSSVFENIIRSIFEELDKIAVIIQICYPLILFLCSLNICSVLCLSVCVTLLTGVLKRLHTNLTDYSVEGIPLPSRKLTKRDIYGFIEFKSEGDIPDALIYLDRIETYLEKRGLVDYDGE